jgi:hypothetical protein
MLTTSGATLSVDPHTLTLISLCLSSSPALMCMCEINALAGAIHSSLLSILHHH